MSLLSILFRVDRPVWSWLAGALLFWVGLGSAAAQNIAPLAAPNLDLHRGGVIAAAVRLPDGSVVVGGSFRSLGGLPRRNIAKLLPDGQVDPDWAPALGGAFEDFPQQPESGPVGDPGVSALAVDAGGNVYAGGVINSVNDVSTSTLGFRIVKLSGGGSGAVDSSFLVGTNSNVLALSIVGGHLYVGGSFSSVRTPSGQIARQNLAKLDLASGAVDTSWNAGVTGGDVRALAGDAAGGLLVAGAFVSIGGQPRSRLARLNVSTAQADPNWINNLGSPTSLFTGSLQVEPITGNVYVAGSFESVNGTIRRGLARLSAAGVLDPLWNPVSSGSVNSIALDGGGGLLATGPFVAGATSLLARFSTSGAGAVDATFQTSERVSGLVVERLGTSVLVGGQFERFGTAPTAALARYAAANGSPLASPSAERLGIVYAITGTADGGRVVGGWFRRSGAALRGNLLKLLPTGELDPAWQGSAPTPVLALTADSAGVYAGGTSLRKLNPLTGAVEVTWNPSLFGTVRALAADGAGNLYAGGDFTFIAGVSRTRLARLSVSTGVADGFNPGANSTVHALSVVGNAVIVGGDFTEVGGVLRNGLARISVAGPVEAGFVAAVPRVRALALNGDTLYVGGAQGQLQKLSAATGVSDPAFVATLSGGATTHALLVAGDSLFVGGSFFSSAGGAPRQGIAKLDLQSGLARVWNGGVDPNNAAVFALAPQGAGQLLMGGQFFNAGGQGRRSLAAFATADPPPLATVTTLSRSPATSVIGEAINVTATVSSSFGPAPGIVLVSDDLGNSCSIQLPGSCALTPEVTGNRQITATYQPAPGFLASTDTATHAVGMPAPLPLAAPDLRLFGRGFVSALLRLPDGSLLVAGAFSHVGGVPRRNLARVLVDGTVDPGWTTGCDGTIVDIAADPAGATYLIGSFTECGGVPRRTAAKLLPSGAVDSGWEAFSREGQSGSPRDLDVDSSGAVFVVGSSLRLLGSTQSVGAVKLLGSTGAADPAWPSILSSYDVVATDATAVYLSRFFGSVEKRDRLSGVLSWTSPFIDRNFGMVVDSTGRVLVSGSVSSAQPRNGVVRLLTSGALDTSWDTGLGTDVACGRPLISGSSAWVACVEGASIGAASRGRLLRLLDNGAVDPGLVSEGFNGGCGSGLPLERHGSGFAVGGCLMGWNADLRAGLALLGANGESLPTPDAELENSGEVYDMVAHADGSVTVGGSFTRSGARRLGGLLRINPAGGIDPQYTGSVNGFVRSLEADGQGGLWVGGLYSRANGIARSNLVRLLGSGALAAGSNAQPDGMVIALGRQGADLIVGGQFANVGGQARSNLARLNSTGALDLTWNPGTTQVNGTSQVHALAVDGSEVYVGGLFTSIGGQTRRSLAKLDAQGNVIPTWRADAEGSTPSSISRVLALAVAPDRSLYIGGSFRRVAGQPRDFLARLNPDGTPAAWSPAPNSIVNTIHLRADSVFVGGQFSLIGDAGRARLAEIDTSTGVVSAFNPSVGGQFTAVNVIDGFGSGAILAGGSYVRIGAQDRSGLAALSVARPDALFRNGFEAP